MNKKEIKKVQDNLISLFQLTFLTTIEIKSIIERDAELSKMNDSEVDYSFIKDTVKIGFETSQLMDVLEGKLNESYLTNFDEVNKVIDQHKKILKGLKKKLRNDNWRTCLNTVNNIFLSLQTDVSRAIERSGNLESNLV